MKIGLITYGLRESGNEKSLLRLAKKLPSYGYDVEIIVTEYPLTTADRERAGGARLRDMTFGERGRSPWQAIRLGKVVVDEGYDALFLSDARTAL